MKGLEMLGRLFDLSMDLGSSTLRMTWLWGM